MRFFIMLIPVFIIAKNFDFCTSCHNGRKAVILNNLKKSYIRKKLYEFKNKKGTMSYIAKSLSKKDIEIIIKKYGRE